jgi:hypothetical protein
MPCTVSRDEHGALYRVPAFTPDKKYAAKLDASPHIDVWWDRGARKDDEVLMIRQENTRTHADVVSLTLGQAFDLLHALASAIKDI